MKLQEWMDRERLLDGAAAEVLGFDRSTVYRWRRGQRSPSAKLMAEIAERTLGAVMPNDWVDLGAGSPPLDHLAETPDSEPVP